MLSKVLAKRRGENSNPIKMTLSPGLLIDKEYCDSLADELKDTGDEWEYFIVNKESGAHIPDKKGIYMFIWNHHFKLSTETEDIQLRTVMYVGKTTKQTLQKRFNQEYKNIIHSDFDIHWKRENEETTREIKLKKVLSLENIEGWFLVSDDDDEIERLEKKLIKTLTPPGNSEYVKPIRAKRLPPETAF